MQTYLFYDIETTGLNKAFDQVLQFAAIRTDLELNELERYELKVKLNPDVTPSPYAVITHHIGIKESREGMTEIEAIKQIHQWLNHPGTISVGYNTLGFDDEFLRFSFYRNLLPVYTHQYANQCSRMDIYPMTIMYYLFKNATLQWPKKAEKISLKLEDLNAANAFFSGRSHHAMTDVEITLELSRCLYKEPKMWEYLLGYFNKSIDNQRSQDAKGDVSLMVSGKFGSDREFLSPVMYLGDHQHYKHQLWLRLDLELLSTTTSETIATTTWAIRKKVAEPGFLLPQKPHYWEKVKPEIMEIVKRNQLWLKANPGLLQEIKQYHSHYLYPVIPETDVDAYLYLNGFWSKEEEQFCRRFHVVDPSEKSLMTERLKSPRLKELATRLLGRHYPEAMTQTQNEFFAGYLQRVNDQPGVVDFRGEVRLTPARALSDIQTIRKKKELSMEQIGLLDELEIALR